MDPELIIVVTILSLVVGMVVVAVVYRRGALAKIRAAPVIRSPLRSTPKLALTIVVVIFGIPGVFVPLGIHFQIGALPLVLGMIVGSMVGIGIAIWSPWTVNGEIALEGDSLRQEQSGKATLVIDLSQPYRLTEGWGENAAGIVVSVGVTQGAYTLYFHYPRPIKGAVPLAEGTAIGPRGPGVGLEGLVIHERLRARDAA